MILNDKFVALNHGFQNLYKRVPLQLMLTTVISANGYDDFVEEEVFRYIVQLNLS